MERQGEIESPRFLWVAALTIAVSVIAVLAVRAAAVRILHPSPTFEPLAFEPPMIDTIFLCNRGDIRVPEDFVLSKLRYIVALCGDCSARLVSHT
jgi:hypothetical protein